MPIVTCKVFHRDIGFPMMEEEVGQGTDLLICHPGGGAPALRYEGVVGTDHVYRVDNSGLGADLKVSLQDWKRPAPPLVPPPVPSSWNPTIRQVEDLNLLLGALVRMFGGSVTISPSEIESAKNGRLINYMMQDPNYMVLKYEESE